MNYYRRYSGDYLRDTARLSMLEHGAYNLLLDYYYSEEQPLPLDHQELYLMLRAMRPEDRKAVDKVLGVFFTIEPDGYHQKRVDHEIEVSKKARDNGKHGGRPPTETITGLVTEQITTDGTVHQTGSVTGPLTETITGSGHPPTSNLQPPATSLQPPEKAKTARKKRALVPVPEDWKPSERVAQRLTQEYSLPEGGIARYTVAFIDICASKGHEYVSIDAGFANCVRQDWPKFRQNGAMAPAKKTAAQLLDESEAQRMAA